MRYLFVVQGEGRGHLTQALSLASILRRQGHEVVKVFFFLPVHLFGEHIHTSIVGGCGQCPGTEFLIGFFQVGTSGTGGFFHVIAFVHVIRHL